MNGNTLLQHLLETVLKDKRDIVNLIRKTQMPEYVRMPPAGVREYYTGLTRASLYNLIKSKSIESKTVRQAGKQSGVRLIHLESLISYLEELAPDSCEEISSESMETGNYANQL